MYPTAKDAETVAYPPSFVFPATSNRAVGLVMPMPRFPAEVMRIFSDGDVPNVMARSPDSRLRKISRAVFPGPNPINGVPVSNPNPNREYVSPEVAIAPNRRLFATSVLPYDESVP